MFKLYFRYGAMGAAKSLNLLAVAHNYRRQGKTVFLVKPYASIREFENSERDITSRTGLHERVDVLLTPGDTFTLPEGVSCILVDEAQFLTTEQVGLLRRLTATCPVICYGLRCDYEAKLFPGSRRLMELADSIEEIKTTCSFCERKATQNLRTTGEVGQVLVGGDESYSAACWSCFVGRR